MTADEFIAWAMQQPEGQRYELVGGEVIGMAPGRVAHARTKGQVFLTFADALGKAGLPCEVFVDGMAVRVDADTVYEPDAFVRCGQKLDDNDVEVTDPLIVMEVVSPSSYKRDSGLKLEGYFRIPSVRHYLIIRTADLAVIHHRRDDAGAITTNIIRSGPIRLDPPGLEFTLKP
ncbi:MAG: Uma2 family endonuclease [Proteobacteria bacterium]|nr:Uma2 family endonuclease [Pseudomonadota bacterium]